MISTWSLCQLARARWCKPHVPLSRALASRLRARATYARARTRLAVQRGVHSMHRQQREACARPARARQRRSACHARVGSEEARMPRVRQARPREQRRGACADGASPTDHHSLGWCPPCSPPRQSRSMHSRSAKGGRPSQSKHIPHSEDSVEVIEQRVTSARWDGRWAAQAAMPRLKVDQVFWEARFEACRYTALPEAACTKI